MSERTEKHHIFLKFLATAVTQRQLKAVLLTANRGQILALAEVILNLLKDNHQMTKPRLLPSHLTRKALEY